MNSPGSRQRRPALSAFGAARTPSRLQETARLVEQAGFSSLWVPEGAQPVFEMCTAAALGTPSLRLGTSVAVAFARSPMLTAQAAWMLSQATEGRFVLGLGTQVRAHVERRYSAPFSSPGPRMREYVQAVRAIYAAFRGTPLRFDGKFYSFSLLPPTWSPGPIDYADPPIYAAGVRPWMCRMVGEVADGMLIHPLSTPAYIDSVVVPAIEEGLQTGGRRAGDVALVCPVMTAVSDDEDVRARQRESIRTRIAFYGSTPGYGVVFDASGWPGVGEELHRLQRTGDLQAMSRAVTDDIIDGIAITSTWEDLPARLVARFAGRADEIVCYSVVEQWSDDTDSLGHWQDINRRFKETSGV
jgi:probable F420-dependent oxidoreductase